MLATWRLGDGLVPRQKFANPLLYHPSIAHAFDAHKSQAVRTQVYQLGVIEVRPLLVCGQELEHCHTTIAACAVGEVQVPGASVLRSQ